MYLLKSKLEIELEEFYSALMSISFGIPRAEALEFVQTIVDECKTDLKKWGYGREESGIAIARGYLDRTTKKNSAIYDRLQQEHVTDEDITGWWDRPMFEIEVEKRFEAKIKLAMVLHYAMDMEISNEEAFEQFLQSNYIFGNIDVSVPFSPDSPLPWELKIRVETSNIFEDQDNLEYEIQTHSSFNALIREKIEEGLI